MYYSCIIIHLRYSTISPRHPRKTNITVPRLLTLLFAALSLSLSLFDLLRRRFFESLFLYCLSPAHSALVAS